MHWYKYHKDNSAEVVEDAVLVAFALHRVAESIELRSRVHNEQRIVVGICERQLP